MKTIRHYANPSTRLTSENLLHIETEGCVVNIHVGLTDAQGRRVTAISISPDDEARGGDGQGFMWHVADDAGKYGARIVRQEQGVIPQCRRTGCVNPATLPDGRCDMHAELDGEQQ